MHTLRGTVPILDLFGVPEVSKTVPFPKIALMMKKIIQKNTKKKEKERKKKVEVERNKKRKKQKTKCRFKLFIVFHRQPRLKETLG